MRKLLFVPMLAVLAFAAAPGSASADWYLTPFVGGNFGGNANFGGDNDLEDQVERRVDLGASLGWMGNGIAGFEVDWCWAYRLVGRLAAACGHTCSAVRACCGATFPAARSSTISPRTISA